jgi:DNA adenine methylase
MNKVGAIGKPASPVLRYHGSKFRLAPWIIEHFPTHMMYCEPFGGGAGVLLRKAPSEVEVYNDLDDQVVGFFRQLREHTTELMAQILLTPYARAEAIACREPSDDPMEQARRTYVTSWQLFGGGQGKWHTGWRRQRRGSDNNTTARWEGNTLNLLRVAARLRTVHLECKDALQCIPFYDGSETLFYCDPPYLAETRSKWRKSAYRHEMSHDDHRSLARVLHEIQGMVIVSGYESDLYAEMYPGWEICRTEARTDRGVKKIECLYLSPRTSEARYRGFSNL